MGERTKAVANLKIDFQTPGTKTDSPIFEKDDMNSTRKCIIETKTTR